MGPRDEQQQVTLGEVYRIVKGIEADLKERFVTQAEFRPVQRIVYGFVSVTLLAVIGALLLLVVK